MKFLPPISSAGRRPTERVSSSASHGNTPRTFSAGAIPFSSYSTLASSPSLHLARQTADHTLSVPGTYLNDANSPNRRRRRID